MATRVISQTLTNVQTTGGVYIFLDENGDPSALADTTYNPVYNVKAVDGTDVLGTVYVKALDRITFYPPENGVTIAFHIAVTVADPVVILPTAGLTVYGKSTYDQLIDVLLSDIPKPELRKLPPQTLMDWILRAEERICRLTSVREEFVLRYRQGVSDYELRNRPAISNATNATPIVITSSAHGITVNKRVYVFGCQGNTAANGTWFTSSAATDSLTINPGSYISGVAVDSVGLKVTTEVAHGFTTGDTITIAGMDSTPIPDNDYTVTVVDDTNFTITYSPADPTYSGGGVAYKKSASTGNGIYSGGGRIWMDSELPTYINKVIGGSVFYGGINYNVRGYTIDDLNRERPYYPSLYLSAFPLRAAIFTKGALRFLRVDPAPQSDGDFTIYGEVQVTPKDHYGEDPSLVIQLPSEYDPMILDFMKARAYEKFGQFDGRQVYETEFNERVREHNMNQTSTLINVVYR